MFTCAKKVSFISGNGSEKAQYVTLLKMGLIRQMVSIAAWQSQHWNCRCREGSVGTGRVQTSSRGKSILVPGSRSWREDIQLNVNPSVAQHHQRYHQRVGEGWWCHHTINPASPLPALCLRACWRPSSREKEKQK